ncbi:MAG TPA: M14 family zinc carboxypeptidase [Bryobacteraceae bacterium]|nr:M14 family zinc carboxypeptidase [Bryobacteraceae bacterium]
MQVRSRVPVRLVAALSLLAANAYTQTILNEPIGRVPNQRIDDWYSKQISKYTTAPEFNSPLTNYLPASAIVPTPAKILGDVAGAPDMLPYAEDVYRYFRLLASTSPRVKVFTIGHSEEGREMIAAAVADESLLSQVKANDQRLAKLADPRSISLDDNAARKLIGQSFPVYYITGTIHSPETGAPTALMELAYRLAVDESPYIQFIRSHMVVLITPIVEVDGRDRMVDIYRWHKAHPAENWPRLLYWGHYVAHDNNRDAMAMTLNLTRNVLDTYLDWHAQALHDLHESVPFLYDNTVGDGPYNAWIDPLLADEWAMLGWNNVAQMQNFGMPGVFTHGDFDTWSPGYLMFLASMHNGISRLYETFGNAGADTQKRILTPDEYSRTWFRPNPPYPTVIWSQRDNNNYEQTALLTTLSYFSHNAEHFLTNFYIKSKRSVEKPKQGGPAAYVLSADDAFLNRQLQLLKVLFRQHVEVSRLDQQITVAIPATHSPKPDEPKEAKTEADKKPEQKARTQTIPAGSYVVRMDQPYSRAADALLDRQFWSPEDPQKHPYDDTGWSFGDLFNAKVARVTDASILQAKMSRVTDLAPAALDTSKAASLYVVNNTGQVTLASLIYALKSAKFLVAEQSFDNAGRRFAAGSLLIQNADSGELKNALTSLDLTASPLDALPKGPTHSAAAPRIAFMHTWIYTQTEGWWRLAFDSLHVPYSYINTQSVCAEPDLRSRFDVIIFAPSDSATAQIVNGLPLYGNPLPWKQTSITPNIGKLDQTDDMRPGLGQDGVSHLRKFIDQGGLLITAEDTAQFAIESGLTPGVFLAPRKSENVVGSVLNAVVVDRNHPVGFGYSSDFGVYSADGMAFNVGNLVVHRNLPTAKEYKRVTGRGGPEDEDIPLDRGVHEPAMLPSPKPWQPTPLNEEQARNNPYVIPEKDRPNVIIRFGDSKGLLLSGLLESAEPIAERAAVVDAHLGNGNVLLFANNPVYRGETIGSYALVFNAIINFDHLSDVAASPPVAPAPPVSPTK